MNKYSTGFHLEEVQEHGVSINPTAFLVVQPNLVKLLPVKHTSTIDKILDYVPDIIEKANVAMDKCLENKKDLGEKIVNTMKKRCEKNEKNENKEENQNDDSGDVEKKVEIKIEKEDENEQE